ncbi:mitochondrial ribosomal protein S23 [Dermatophagoides pteronyssinus]|uniref:Small ribosomal subunit protein mS23 n=1 Tax=Dermatophagoides pteronyssinus TaxID=6956 RepID=A0ABQ8JM43_DERPT|nr:Structural constituent of ribosome [Dermatophagoides pteronyssinus]
MAGSRVEKLSTIFKRYTGLIKSGAVLEENRPIWYDIYKHFPPSIEPLAIRPEPEIDIKPIFYPEDILRSRFFRTYGDSIMIHDFISSKPSDLKTSRIGIGEMFIAKYLQLAQSKGLDEIDLNSQELFDETEKSIQTDCGVQLKRRKDYDQGNRTIISTS